MSSYSVGESKSTGEKLESVPVRGPSSALTSFFRENNIKVGKVSRFAKKVEIEIESPSNLSSDTDRAEVSKRKISKRKAFESTYEPSSEGTTEDDSRSLKSILEAVGVRICSRCSRRFLLRAHNDVICEACSIGRHGNRDGKKVVKRGKKGASGDLLPVDDDNLIVKPLRVLCMDTIAKNIDTILHLGHIPSETKIKISMIVSRYRMLNSSNCWLFCDPNEPYVHLYDCSNLSADTIKTVISRTNGVRSLYLGFCGQIRDDCIYTLARSCQHIEELSLTGAYLVSDDALANLFEMLAIKLKTLKLNDATKFNILAASALAKYCHNLSSLTLENCSGIDSRVVECISSMKSLLELTIEGSKEVSVSENSLGLLMSSLGPNLVKISLSKFDCISDDFIRNHIVPYVAKLNDLRIEQCSKITTDGFDALTPHHFKDSSLSTSLTHLSLKRCSGILDRHIVALVKIFGSSLKSLNLNGLSSLSKISLDEITANCRALESIDVSWIMSVDDGFITNLAKVCPSIKKFTIYGCYEVTRDLIPTLRHRNKRLAAIKFLGYEFV